MVLMIARTNIVRRNSISFRVPAIMGNGESRISSISNSEQEHEKRKKRSELQKSSRHTWRLQATYINH